MENWEISTATGWEEDVIVKNQIIVFLMRIKGINHCIPVKRMQLVSRI